MNFFEMAIPKKSTEVMAKCLEFQWPPIDPLEVSQKKIPEFSRPIAQYPNMPNVFMIFMCFIPPRRMYPVPPVFRNKKPFAPHIGFASARMSPRIYTMLSWERKMLTKAKG